MKKEQLLEAIGGIDAQYLLETEQITRPVGRNVRRLALIAAIITAFSITVAASAGMLSGLLKGKDNGSAVANLSTGMGSFVYSDNTIYSGEPGFIYKYDLEGKLLKTYKLDSEQETPMYMFATEDAIVYVDSFNKLMMLPENGTQAKQVAADIGMTFVHVDGTYLYTTEGTEMLTRIDLVTGEVTQLLENVNTYYIDDTYIYAVQSGGGNYYFRSPKDTVAFEKIALDFVPNKVIADGQDLYFCQWVKEDLWEDSNMRYRVNLVSNGKTTQLPVYSWFYQILDGCVLYLEDGTYCVKCYDLQTGETKLLQENVFEFSVLKDRYICFDLNNQASVVYDWETGESVALTAQ